MRGHEPGIDWTDELGTEEDRKRAVRGVADDQVGHAVAVEVGRDDLRRQTAGGQRSDLREAIVTVSIERDRVVAGIDAGQHGPLIRVRNPGDVERGGTRVDRDRGLEGAGLAGDALAVEDVAGGIEDQDVRGAIAIDVGHDRWSVSRDGGDFPGSEKVPSPLPSSTDTLLTKSKCATARSVRPSPLKSPATMASGPDPDGVGDLGLEGAVAVAQQHGHRTGARD